MKTHALLVLGVTLAVLAACGSTTPESTSPTNTIPGTRTLTSADPAGSSKVPDAARQ